MTLYLILLAATVFIDLAVLIGLVIWAIKAYDWKLPAVIIFFHIMFSCLILSAFLWYGQSHGYGEILTGVTSPIGAPTSEVDQAPAQAPNPAENVTPAVTEEAPFTGIVIKGCPTESFGPSPIKPGEDLKFVLKPYGDDDPEVLCEFEAYSATQVIKWELPEGQTAIVADWVLGYQRDDNGDFIDECQEKDNIAAPECEGTWVATGTNYIPKGVLIHGYVRVHEYATKARFATNITWVNADGSVGSMDAFACEYVAHTFLTDDGRRIVHNEDSIRVPVWADHGTIYGFDRKLAAPLHCPLP